MPLCKSHILTTPHPKGHVMSGKCEQPLDELTVQVWLLYDKPNFKYCTLSVSGTELRTEKWMDHLITRQLGIIYNIRDILQIGRFSSSGDNFVSDSGDCLFIGRTDFQRKKETVMRITVCICAPYNCRFQMEMKKRWGQTRVF